MSKDDLQAALDAAQDEIEKLISELAEKRAQLQAVIDLHHDDGEGWCAFDEYRWPCRTAQALTEALGGAS